MRAGPYMKAPPGGNQGGADCFNNDFAKRPLRYARSTPPTLERKAAEPPAHASPLVVSVARIALQADGGFAYDRSRSLALTLAVEDRHGDFADVVAWGRDPCRWWLRCGDVVAGVVARLRRQRARAAT